jgi:hypothetical protein
MKKIIGSQNLWAIIIIIILILVVPYSLGWFWYSPATAREFMYDWRLWSAGWALLSAGMCNTKVYLREIVKWKWLNKKENEMWVDIFLNLFFIIPAGVIYFIHLIPALVISLILYGISIDRHARFWAKIEIIATYIVFILVYIYSSNQTLYMIVNFLFFVQTLKLVLYVLINFISSVRDDKIFVNRIISGLYWVLSNGLFIIIGAPRRIHGKLPDPDKYQAIYANHGGAITDYAIPNVVDVFTPIKPVAGSNLLKWPILGLFIKMICIITERPEGNTKGFGQWSVYQLLRLFFFILNIFKIGNWLKKTKLWNWATYKKSKKTNANNVVLIGESIEDGEKVFLYTDGRDRLSKFLAGIMKTHGIATARFADSIVPMLIRGSMRFRAATKGEPLRKKLGWRFPIWCSPCFLDLHLYPVMNRLENEDDAAFTKRVDDFLYEKQSEFGFTI